jgi:predicted MFS family arabinose efflux permease
MVQIRLFTNRRFVLAALSLAVAFFALFGTLFELSQYLQLVHGYSPLKAGAGAMPFAVAMAATSATSALTAKRLGIRGTLTTGLVLVATGLGALATAQPHTAYALVAAYTAIVGAGMGMMMAPASLEITGSVPTRYASMAGSLNSVVRELGGVLGIAVIGSVVSASYRDSVPASLGPIARHDLPSAHAIGLPPQVLQVADRAFTDAMSHGVLIAAGVALAAAVLMFAGLRPSGRTPAPATVEDAETPAMV